MLTQEEQHVPDHYSRQKKAIGTIEEGEIMEVLSADEGTKVDIPKWCSKQGHDYLGTVEENGYFKIYMRKNEI